MIKQCVFKCVYVCVMVMGMAMGMPEPVQAIDSFDPEESSYYRIFVSYRNSDLVLGTSSHQVYGPKLYVDAEVGISLNSILNLDFSVDAVYSRVGVQCASVGYKRTLSMIKGSSKVTTPLNELYYEQVTF